MVAVDCRLAAFKLLLLLSCFSHALGIEGQDGLSTEAPTIAFTTPLVVSCSACAVILLTPWWWPRLAEHQTDAKVLALKEQMGKLVTENNKLRENLERADYELSRRVGVDLPVYFAPKGDVWHVDRECRASIHTMIERRPCRICASRLFRGPSSG